MTAQPAPSLDIQELVNTHADVLYRYAYRLSGNAADAEDLTQEAFLTASQKLNQVRDADHVLGWLFTILRNSYLRSRRRVVPHAAADLALDLETLPETVDESDLDRELLQSALNELPDEFKVIVLMFYFEDCSYREISQRLELPIGTVMSRLSRAKGHLRRRVVGPEDKPQRIPPPNSKTSLGIR